MPFFFAKAFAFFIPDLEYENFFFPTIGIIYFLLLIGICGRNIARQDLPQILYYLLITNVITHSQAVEEPPSVIISIDPASSTLFAAVGSAVSTSPAADPDWVTVIPPPVIAVPPISKDRAALADDIAFLIEVPK